LSDDTELAQLLLELQHEKDVIERQLARLEHQMGSQAHHQPIFQGLQKELLRLLAVIRSIKQHQTTAGPSPRTAVPLLP
jgi:hypothetical protein